jgi:hypothetical protein
LLPRLHLNSWKWTSSPVIGSVRDVIFVHIVLSYNIQLLWSLPKMSFNINARSDLLFIIRPFHWFQNAVPFFIPCLFFCFTFFTCNCAHGCVVTFNLYRRVRYFVQWMSGDEGLQ